MNTALTDMLGKRRDRSISIILGVKERECDPYLTREQSQKLRKVVLDQVNDLVDFALDVCHSLDRGDVQLNDAYLEKLDRVYEVVVGGEMNGVTDSTEVSRGRSQPAPSQSR